MLIIAGHLVVDPAARDAYVDDCRTVVSAALAAPGCRDFAISADGADPARIRIFERWEAEEPMLAFRGSGPTGDQQTAIVDADVRRYEISSISDA